ncbi:MAG: SsrA-binding protein SmpB [Planctomycetota bacterium]
MSSPAEEIKVVSSNRKARHTYDILETFEAGMVLRGTEVKSLRDGKCDLGGSFAVVEADGVYLKGAEIGVYSHGNRQNHEPRRNRKLLLSKREIQKIRVKTRERGFTLIPLRLYFRRGLAKVELAVAKGRKLHDHRQAQAKKEADREMKRAVGRRKRN